LRTGRLFCVVAGQRLLDNHAVVVVVVHLNGRRLNTIATKEAESVAARFRAEFQHSTGR
jgi:hypothetical protein